MVYFYFLEIRIAVEVFAGLRKKKRLNVLEELLISSTSENNNSAHTKSSK